VQSAEEASDGIIRDEFVGDVTIKDAEKELIRKTLEKNENNRRQTAKDLDLIERTLYRKIKEYEL